MERMNRKERRERKGENLFLLSLCVLCVLCGLIAEEFCRAPGALFAAVFGWTLMIRMPHYSLMHCPIHISRFLFLVGIGMLVSTGLAQTAPAASAASAAKPYKIANTTQVLGTGGIDYVYADNEGRRLYVPRGDQV